jgi:phage terminase large subunit
MFQRTTAQAKIAALRSRVRVVQGGTSSSKTFSIIPTLIMYAINNKGAEISIVSESIPHLRRGAIRDFIKIMEWIGNPIESNWNRSTLTYNFSNGSFIEFFSADQSDKLRGARRDVLFVNEANNIGWEAYHQMSIRTRRFVYIDYNPTAEFWAHKELIGKPDVDFIILTYKDNEALEPAIVKEIEAAKEKAKDNPYWANWWKVYGLGEIGNLQGVVFNNWQQCDKMPEAYKWKAYGLDWGFTNDPTAVVEVCEFDGKLWLNEILYEKGLTNADIAQKIDGFRGQELIADSAEPKSIEDLRRHGFRIRACQKGRDSVRAGIDKMQQYPLMVTSNSVNLIRELRGYTWATDRSGEQTGEPIDDFNHAIDAARYIIMEKLRTRSGQYAIR